MEAVGEAKAEGWFQLMRLIKRIGGHIIDFLAQIEEFQKMLWEKRKSITETFTASRWVAFLRNFTRRLLNAKRSGRMEGTVSH